MEKLVEVQHLKKYFNYHGSTRDVIKAVDDLSFSVFRGETLGLVGESGCGKTTTGRLILRLLEPTAGEVLFETHRLSKKSAADLRNLRREMQIVFQDPAGSLHPRMTVQQILEEPFKIHGLLTKSERRERVAELMNLVGLSPSHLTRYSHEFSGGQRQRIGIARAFALNPKFIVCDEPVSALDVSVQSQILNLLCELQERFGLTYLFIAHGLNVVKHISDRVGVMYLGKMVELGPANRLYHQPQHPYTQALLSSIPKDHPGVTKERILLTGEIPSPLNPPQGCRFSSRCPFVKPICKEEEPLLQDVGGGHMVACHLYQTE